MDPSGTAPGSDSPFPEEWFGHALFSLIWFKLLFRSALAVFVAWGLHERASWARIVAIVLSFLSLFAFPFGTALGIWTLVVLLGYRNATLDDQLGPAPPYSTSR